jgi:uncharacterized surface anchored protein
MKNLRIMAIMICSVLTLASCETEELQGPSIEHSESKEKIVNNKDGGGTTGGEEEDPIIIRGLTQGSSDEPVVGAEVVLYDSDTNQEIDSYFTDSNGDFEFSELSGTYYFNITASGYVPFESADLDFPLNNGIVFTLQEN